MTKESQVALINREINEELGDPKVVSALLATVFKGMDATSMKKAMMEGMIRGFKFKDFLDKNVYAIPFSGSTGYSLITSIDYNRKMGMRSGIVGKTAPEFEEKDGKVVSCTVTVKRKIDDYVGEFTAKVYFSEYDKKNNLWNSKPRTMIAKVAEMHALRMACPEELAQSYIEEEIGAEIERRESAKELVESSGLKAGNFRKKDGKKEARKEDVEIVPVEDANGVDAGEEEGSDK